MPYNINPPCPSQTRITVVHGGRVAAIWTGIADDYKIDIIPENPFIHYYLVIWYRSYPLGESPTPLEDATVDEQGRVSFRIWLGKKVADDPDYSHIEVTSFYRDPISYAYYYPLYRLTKIWRLKNGSTTAPVTQNYLLPYDNFGGVGEDRTEMITINTPYKPTYYNVKLFKNNQLVDASNNYADLPQISWECLGSCPPGTCQVDCGNVYCCYGSNGIAVSSFSK